MPCGARTEACTTAVVSSIWRSKASTAWPSGARSSASVPLSVPPTFAGAENAVFGVRVATRTCARGDSTSNAEELSQATIVSPSAPVTSCGECAPLACSVCGRVNSPTRRAAVRRPRGSVECVTCCVQTATDLPEASVPSCGVSPNSPSVWTLPSFPPVVIRHCRRFLPLALRPRQSTVMRPVPGCTATAGSGVSAEVPTLTGAAHESSSHTLRYAVRLRAKTTAPWPSSSTAARGCDVMSPVGPSSSVRTGNWPTRPSATIG